MPGESVTVTSSENDEELAHDEGPGPMDRALPRAVAEGFEPSVTCATLAFEASSFGRSDTLPRETLQHAGRCFEIGIRGSVFRGRSSVGAEESGEDSGAVFGEYALDHLGAVVEPPVAYDVPERAGRAGLLVAGAVDDPVHP